MENSELENRIQELLEEHRKIKDVFINSLSPEQLVLQKDISDFAAKELRELLEIKKAQDLEDKIKKAKEEDPFIQEVETLSQGGLDNSITEVKENKTRFHYILPLVCKAVKAKCNTWLVGPAGSGKTTLASHVASRLKLPFASISVCSQTTKTDLLGYLDAQGIYRSTSFRQIYENGGVFCLDEIDNGNANVLAVLNSAISNDSNSFPDKVVKRHPNFIVIACANTFGLGSTAGYVGRTQIDAATLDRFFFVEMPYDDGLESHIAGLSQVPSPSWDAEGNKVPKVDFWIDLVKKTRDAASKLGIKIIVSPRATYMGISLIKQNVPLQFLEKGLLYKSLSNELILKLRQS
jgi:hypothetical protein